MSSEHNIATYRRLIETVVRDDRTALHDVCAVDVVDHNPIPGQALGIEGIKHWMASMHTSFPDIEAIITEVVASGDKVAGRVIWRGTHQGSFAGVPPTGRPVEFAAMHLVRVESGKVVEWWGVADMLSALQQIGAM